MRERKSRIKASLQENPILAKAVLASPKKSTDTVTARNRVRTIVRAILKGL
jgi:hypothetical protein